MTEQEAPAVPGVTAEALRAYMAATGWTEPSHEGGPAGKIWSKGPVSFGVPHTDAPDVLRSALERLAKAEGRSPALVARTIVAVYGGPESLVADPGLSSPAPALAGAAAASTGALEPISVAAIPDREALGRIVHAERLEANARLKRPFFPGEWQARPPGAAELPALPRAGRPGGGVNDYTEQVRAYLAYCRRAAAELKARGSFLSPEHHPTAAGAVKMIPHRGDQAEARAIEQAFSDLTEPAP